MCTEWEGQVLSRAEVLADVNEPKEVEVWSVKADKASVK